MNQVTVLFNGHKQAVHLLDEPHVVIGRGRSAHIPLDGNPIVSRQHAVIREEGGEHVLEDLGGANGTFLNDGQVRQARLRTGDRITIGKHTLRYEAATPEAATLRRGPAADEDDASTVRVEPVGKKGIEPPPWSVDGRPPRAAPMALPEGAQATMAASPQELEALLAQMKIKSGPHLSINRGGKLQLVPLVQPPIRIGNDDAFEVRLPGSRWFGKLAGELVEEKGKWWLVARSPFWNPLSVGKSKVKQRRRLNNGATITAGDLKLRFSLGDDG